jgi:hypothetical protein
MNTKNTKYASRNLSVRAASPVTVENNQAHAEELKSALIKKLTAEYTSVEPLMVYHAVTEAHALASLTTVPLLLLPALAEEKVQQAEVWATHQRSLLGGSQWAFAA